MSTVVKDETVAVSPDRVQTGDLMTFTHWGIVESSSNDEFGLGNKVVLTDVDSGVKFSVHGDALIQSSHSADQYDVTRKVNKTEMVDILAHARNVPFSVTFIKKNGEERTLRGRLIGIDQKNLGYIDVEDLDLPEGDRFRLVDCRTIETLIVNGIRYET